MKDVHSILKHMAYSVSSHEVPNATRLTLMFIRDPNGQIRWLWPASLESPLFLNFYHVKGWKPQVFSLVVKCIFALHLQHWIFSKQDVYITKNDNKLDFDIYVGPWTLFTGTPGPNRKYIVFRLDSSGHGVFTKLALTMESKNLLQHEARILNSLSCIANLGFEIPRLLTCNNGLLSISTHSEYSSRSKELSSYHFDFFKRTGNIDAESISFESLDNLWQLCIRLEALKNNRQRVPSGIIKKLISLHQKLRQTTLDKHLAHGDFTPWNMYTDHKGQLYIYDWELAGWNYPRAFDFFHYLIQNGIMTDRKNWSEIKTEIYSNAPFLMNAADISVYLSLYLLIQVTNYLEIYEKQDVWHEQIYWLLNTWNAALSDLLAPNVNERELVISDLFDYLKYKVYAGLKLPENQIEKLSPYADLDLLLPRREAKSIVEFIKRHPLVYKYKIQNIGPMSKLMILTNDHNIINIDCIYKLKRKELVYLSVQEFIDRSWTDKEGVRHVNEIDTALFIALFYGLNNAPIPDKYLKYTSYIITDQQRLDRMRNGQQRTGAGMSNEFKSEMRNRPENRGLNYILNSVQYYYQVARQLLYGRGMVITFSGVDGAGKSTIIEKMKVEIEKRFRKKLIVIRHRPSMLPILSAYTKGRQEAEKQAANSLPRLGNNKSIISSLFRFTYYYLDYLIGQFYVNIRYVMLGYIVLYDRYYFDFINDSIRSNIHLPKWFLRSGYALLQAPHLNYFLYADPKVILARKRELDESTIATLTRDYLQLFTELGSRFPSRYQAIENTCLDKTVGLITRHIQHQII